jgi:lipopolysaccharide/colanic/teichoic acid biosynthesis glycosyltransferase
MFFEITKRIIDIVASTILLIVFSPVMLVTSIIIKLSSAGPVLVEKSNTHLMRLGKDGKLFRLYKFRSMIVNSDNLITKDPKYKKLYVEWKNTNYKLVKDPRVTKIGKFIRKYSIDETPQLFNVLKGEMSLVGPIPYHADELAEQQIKYPGTEKFIKEMHKVKPGITVYWQVGGSSSVNFDKRIEMDAYYARKKSILFDFLILLKTPWAMISGRDAV